MQISGSNGRSDEPVVGCSSAVSLAGHADSIMSLNKMHLNCRHGPPLCRLSRSYCTRWQVGQQGQPRPRCSCVTRAWTVHSDRPTDSGSKNCSTWLGRAALCSYGAFCGLASPTAAFSWPWERQSGLPVPLPPSNFPVALPYDLDYLLGHPFITLGVAAGLYVVVPRLWRLFVRVVVFPVLILAALGFAVQHPAQSLSFGSTAYGCGCPL